MQKDCQQDEEEEEEERRKTVGWTRSGLPGATDSKVPGLGGKEEAENLDVTLEDHLCLGVTGQDEAPMYATTGVKLEDTKGALDKRLGPKPTLLTPHQSGETVAAAVVARDKGSSAGELESKEGELRGHCLELSISSFFISPTAHFLPHSYCGEAIMDKVVYYSEGQKRQAKPAADEGFWDCSVCTFRNSAEAFKCSICDVRKGTSTRKPRINSQLVAQQVAQQYATPPPPKKEKKEKVEKQDKEKPEKDKEISPSVTKKNTNKKTKPKSDILKDPPSEANSIQSANATTKTSETNHTSRPRLKNVDRSTAQQLAVTVGNVTVIITDFKEKTRSSSTSSSTVTSSAGSEQQNQSSSGSESTDKGSSRSSTPKGDMSAVNDESF
nr:RING1 and YY1-binding protein [Cavia porcellus]